MNIATNGSLDWLWIEEKAASCEPEAAAMFDMMKPSPFDSFANDLENKNQADN